MNSENKELLEDLVLNISKIASGFSAKTKIFRCRTDSCLFNDKNFQRCLRIDTAIEDGKCIAYKDKKNVYDLRG